MIYSEKMIRLYFHCKVLLILTLVLLLSCVRDSQAPQPDREAAVNTNMDINLFPEADITLDPGAEASREAFVEDFWRWIFIEAGIPESLSGNVAASALESPAFVMELLLVLQQDPYTFVLVDKEHALSSAYAPGDLVPLTAGSFRVTRDGLLLRSMAVDPLEEMARAALLDGIILTVGSAYRSYANQRDVNANWVRQLGQEAADRISAPAGHSQHQLGLVVDFSPIDPSFAQTPASAWLEENAGRFGWSLSYPDGYEDITGYSWESWHYRYVGRDLTLFIDRYFGGIQQYALQFIHTWQLMSDF